MQKTLILCMFTALLTACAPVTHRIQVDSAATANEARLQRQAAFEIIDHDMRRLLRAAGPILSASAELCGENVSARLGMHPLNKYSFGDEMVDAAAATYGDTTHLLAEMPSAAAQAGIKTGDVLVSINGKPAPAADKKTGQWMADAMKAPLERSEPITLTVNRGGAPVTVEVRGEKTCNSEISYQSDDAVNAFADGKKIYITRGMMRFAQDDTELSLVIAHELAHNAMGHTGKKMGNRFLGAVIDGILAGYGVNSGGAFANAAQQSFSQEFEAEADYVGLYIMAAAGLDIESATKFWRRMAAEHPASISNSMGASHPATPYRFLALEKTVQEIRDKQADGLPLKPEMKEGH